MAYGGIKGKKDNSSKRGTPERRAEARRESARARQEAHDALTTKEKLDKLDARPGESRRERAKLEAK